LDVEGNMSISGDNNDTSSAANWTSGASSRQNASDGEAIEPYQVSQEAINWQKGNGLLII